VGLPGDLKYSPSADFSLSEEDCLRRIELSGKLIGFMLGLETTFWGLEGKGCTSQTFKKLPW